MVGTIALIIAGCEAGSRTTDPNFGVIPPFNGVYPARGDGLTTPEGFQVCKYGSDADFNWIRKDNTTGAVLTGTLHVLDGECWVIASAPGTGALVTATEVVPAGYALDSVRVSVIYGTTITSHLESGPTVTDSVQGTNNNLTPKRIQRGVVAKFYNRRLDAGQIGDFVWRDDNGNGVQDAGEPGIPGQTVYLTGAVSTSTTTGANGEYLFSGLPAGNYTVTVNTPAGYTPSPTGQGTPSTDSDGGFSGSAAVTLPSWNSVDLTIDFGFVPDATGRIGDFVWQDTNGDGVQDAGEPGIPGQTVTLQCVTPTGPTYQTTTTDANGAYLFTGVGAGTCDVTVATPAGYTPSPTGAGTAATDNNGSPASVTLPNQNTTDLTIDFGFVPVPAGSIGDFVWQDTNGNGIQDAGEPGMGGLLVTLTGPVTGTTTTNGSGGYIFTNLPAGCYQVSVSTPAGFVPSPTGAGTTANDNNGSPATVCLATFSSSDLTIDFGFVPNNVGQIGDFVWQDTNGNGIQESGEPGIAGVTVTLSGASSATTTTDANGGYLFTGLGAGSYTVTVGTPAGFSPSPTGAGTAATDNNGSPASVTLPSYNSVDLTIDFGFVPNPAGQIGDFVWQDTNGNGIQDAGENGIGGVTVTLTGPVTATTTTNGFGAYLFTNLPAGCYTVSVGTPSGYTPSPTGQGNTNNDSNGSPTTVCLATYNSVDLSADFGFVPNNVGRIGDFVWKDVNGNGVQDAGEPGIAGVTVTLSGAASATTVTDANGAYLFSGLGAGTYTVTVTAPATYAASPSNQGGDPAKDSNGSPATVTLASYNSSDLTIDFGFVPPTGKIGDYVWEDEDGDGIQDPTEPALDGIVVHLSGPVSASTQTDANGNYLFTGLPAGTYTVTVNTPNRFTPSPSNQGSDDAVDSDGSGVVVVLPTNSSVDLTIDFGFVPPTGTGRMTGGGQQIDIGGIARISRGLTLHCDIALSNNLEINWNDGTTLNNFHITRPLVSAQCILDPAYKQPPPAAPFNTFIGVANGTLNGVPGAVARFTFIDGGEPGRKDKAAIQITAPNGQVVLNIPLGNLDRGNYQAHYDQPHGSNQNGSVGGGKK